MNKIQYNTAYSVQLVTSYYGVGPNTLALTADTLSVEKPRDGLQCSWMSFIVHENPVYTFLSNYCFDFE